MSKGQASLLSLSVMLVFLLPGSALPHGGGLDANGGHHDRKRGGYHYHRGSSVQQSPSRIGRPVQDSQQPIMPTREPIPTAAPILSSLPEREYQMCLQGTDGDTGQFAPGETVHPAAQSPSCAAFFNSYSNTEIADAVVEIRDTWVTIAGVEKIPEMLGKADNPYIYINAGTVVRI